MGFLGCLLVALGAVLSIPMEMTTTRPEATTEDTSGRLLSLPDPDKCAQRPKHFEHGGHSYWFSGDEENFTDRKVDWLDGRNICREYCMDLVSLETPTENELIEDFLVKNDLPYIWTSGRLCNFKGCDREDLQPPTVNGWFWSGSGVKMAPTNSTPPGWSYQPWSYTGHKTQFEARNVSQPDNAVSTSTALWRRAWACSTTSTAMESSGTTLRATTPNRSSARTPTSCSNTSRQSVQTWNCEAIQNPQPALNLTILFIVSVAYLMPSIYSTLPF